MTEKIISKELIKVVTPFRGSFIVRDKKKQKFWKGLSLIAFSQNVNILPVKIKVQ